MSSAESTIERPTHRTTTAFVPRLGKRLDAQQQFDLESLLCAQYAGPDCGRFLAGLSSNKAVAPQDTSLKTLIGSLMGEIAARDENSRLAPSEVPSQSLGANRLELLSSLMAQQLERSPRASEEWGPLNGILSISTRGAGSKRVAFTPRIGRR